MMLNAVLTLFFAATGATTTEVGRWTLIAERSNDELVRVLSDLLPRAQRETEERVGLRLTVRCTAVLCGSRESFQRAAPGFDPRHTLGVAHPELRVLYLNCPEIVANPLESLGITLRHEMSHLVVGEVPRNGFRPVPLWFDEGVAVWSSGKVPFQDPEDFERAAAAGGLPRLADLAGAFPSDLRERGIAYEASESFVRFLVRRHGRAAIGRVLHAAMTNRPVSLGGESVLAPVEFATAFREATGTELPAAEADWLASLRGSWPWLTWAFHAFSLFSAMGILAIVAFWVYWRRRRQKFQEWDAEERLESEGDRFWP